MSIVSFIVLILSSVLIYGAPLVVVDLWTEAKCPPCASTIKTTVDQTVNKPGIWDIIDLKQTPWGNAYCETAGCPSSQPGIYASNIRQCWDKKCNPAGSPAEDCFSCIPKMAMTCQHEKDECTGNRYLGCAINSTATKNGWWNFTLCFEGQHEGDLKYAESCAKSAGYDYAKLTKCVNSDLGIAIDTKNAKHTCGKAHSGTPTIWINGEEWKGFSADSLLQSICKAYTGTKPPVCN